MEHLFYAFFVLEALIKFPIKGRIKMIAPVKVVGRLYCNNPPTWVGESGKRLKSFKQDVLDSTMVACENKICWERFSTIRSIVLQEISQNLLGEVLVSAIVWRYFRKPKKKKKKNVTALKKNIKEGKDKSPNPLPQPAHAL